MHSTVEVHWAEKGRMEEKVEVTTEDLALQVAWKLAPPEPVAGKEAARAEKQDYWRAQVPMAGTRIQARFDFLFASPAPF